MSERPMTASLISSLPLFSLLILFFVIDLSAELANKCEFITSTLILALVDLGERAHKFKTLNKSISIGCHFFVVFICTKTVRYAA